MALAVWFGLSLRPNLWMLMLWMVAAALWAGARLFGIKATSSPPSFWSNALMTMLILLGPAIEDSGQRQGSYRRLRHPRGPVHRRRALRLGDGLGARALARRGGASQGGELVLALRGSHQMLLDRADSTLGPLEAFIEKRLLPRGAGVPMKKTFGGDSWLPCQMTIARPCRQRR